MEENIRNSIRTGCGLGNFAFVTLRRSNTAASQNNSTACQHQCARAITVAANKGRIGSMTLKSIAQS